MFDGVSVLTFDSKAQRAVFDPNGSPGCGWDERQGLAAANAQVLVRSETTLKTAPGEVNSRRCSRGAEEVSSLSEGALGCERVISSRGSSGSSLGPVIWLVPWQQGGSGAAG